MTDNQTLQTDTCPDCQHQQHAPDVECEGLVNHNGDRHWHRCLCLKRAGADSSCHPLMTCQGGNLGYSDIWHLQRGHTLQGADGPVTPDVLTAVPVSSPPPDQTAELERLRTENDRMRHELEVMYGGAFDTLHPAPPADRAALIAAIARACAAHLRDRYSDTWTEDAARSLELNAARIERGEQTAVLRRLAAEAQQPDTETPCERCGHNRQAHNISGCTACPGGWRADHQFTSVDQPPADPWSISYHQLGPARMNPNVCTCGLGPGALTHNEPPHAFNGRPKAGMPGVYGICTDCHHHQSARCHATPGTEPPAHIGGNADDCPA